MNWFINCQNKSLERYLQQKYQNKNTLQSFGWGFSMLREINKIYRYINQVTIQQTKQQTKESVIDNLSHELLKLEFKKNIQ